MLPMLQSLFISSHVNFVTSTNFRNQINLLTKWQRWKFKIETTDL